MWVREHDATDILSAILLLSTTILHASAILNAKTMLYVQHYANYKCAAL